MASPFQKTEWRTELENCEHVDSTISPQQNPSSTKLRFDASLVPLHANFRGRNFRGRLNHILLVRWSGRKSPRFSKMWRVWTKINSSHVRWQYCYLMYVLKTMFVDASMFRQLTKIRMCFSLLAFALIKGCVFPRPCGTEHFLELLGPPATVPIIPTVRPKVSWRTFSYMWWRNFIPRYLWCVRNT